MGKRIQFGLAVAATVLSFAGSWSVAARAAQRHLLSPDEAQRWRAVGSLRVAGQRAPSRRDLATRATVTASDWLSPKT